MDREQVGGLVGGVGVSMAITGLIGTLVLGAGADESLRLLRPWMLVAIVLGVGLAVVGYRLKGRQAAEPPARATRAKGRKARNR